MGQRLITEATSALAAPTSKSAVAEFTESATRGAIRGAHEQMSAELPQHIQAALIAALVVMGAILLGGAVALFSIWRRYQKSTTSLAIVAEKINQYESKELKDAIQQGATQNHVGPWLSHFLKNRGL